MIYLDSSALLKLLVEEQESRALLSWLSEHERVPRVSSDLAKVEVIRAARRLDAAWAAEARSLIGRVDLLPISDVVVDLAADTGEPLLRSLDAIHLASALTIRDELTAFVAYDRRLVDAARAAGLPVAQPGTPASSAES